MTEHDILMWLLPVLGGITSLIAFGILEQLKKLSGHIERLSIDMATIAERVNSHEKRITHLERE